MLSAARVSTLTLAACAIACGSCSSGSTSHADPNAISPCKGNLALTARPHTELQLTSAETGATRAVAVGDVITIPLVADPGSSATKTISVPDAYPNDGLCIATRATGVITVFTQKRGSYHLVSILGPPTDGSGGIPEAAYVANLRVR